MSVAEQVYQTTIQGLPEEDRRRLVTLIVEGLQVRSVDVNALEGYSDEWTEEDMRDFSNASLQYFDEKYGSDDDPI